MEYTEIKEHEAIGTKVKVVSHEWIVRGLWNKTGVIDYLKKQLDRNGKTTTYYVIKLDEPYRPTEHMEMKHVQLKRGFFN